MKRFYSVTCAMNRYNKNGVQTFRFEIELKMIYLFMFHREIIMGNILRKQTSEYYKQSGEIHLSEIGRLMDYHQNWPRPDVSQSSYVGDGRWFCDSKGIPRDGNWIRIGEFSSKFPILFGDLKFYYLDR